VIDEEWLRHGFVGALAKTPLMWAWDQFAMQGWGFASELAAVSLWLIRREIRQLDYSGAGATELRGVLTKQLQVDAKLSELQALLASSAFNAREKAAAFLRASGENRDQDGKPDVMIKMPLAHAALSQSGTT
jgi:hypothetical protein